MHEGHLLEPLLEAALGDVRGHLLRLALLDGELLANLQLFVDGSLVDGAFVEGNRGHGCRLHGDVLAHLTVHVTVEGHESTQAVTRVDVGHNGITGNLLVTAHLDALAEATHLVGDFLPHGHATRVGAAEQGILVGRGLGHSDVENALGEGHVVSVLGNEVRLTVERDDAAAIASLVGGGEHGTFTDFVVTTLGGDFLSLLAKDLNGLVEIAFGFNEGLLAVHHASSSLLAELVDVRSGNAHGLGM